MRTLAHISDVHFGREDPEIVEALLAAVAKAKPDVVVVSGDLTQRAKKRQFRAARAFLRELPKVPYIVVPGNHDVSTTNLVERALRPLVRYHRYITEDMNPFYEDGEVAIAGINTVRLLATKDGRVNASQVEIACKQLSSAGGDPVRVIVTHHPMDMPASDVKHALVTRSTMAMHLFAACKVDLFLSGHLHTGLTVATSARYKLKGYSAVVAQAGTAASTRTRGVPNSWNLIRIAPGSLEIGQMAFGGKRFEPGLIERYAKSPGGWVLTEPHPAGPRAN